jgi:hypothetical protein
VLAARGTGAAGRDETRPATRAIAAGGLEGMEHLVVGTQHGGRAETVAGEQCREVIGMCRRLDDMGMSAAVLQVGRRTLARVDDLLWDCTSAAARRPLTLLAGELSQIVGHAAAELLVGAELYCSDRKGLSIRCSPTCAAACPMGRRALDRRTACRPSWRVSLP